MTSDRKIDANRANAQFSTGPQTKPGRARAARNALRHGLNLPAASSDPAFSEEIEALAREIAGPTADPQILDLARQVAERQIDVDRVRYARHESLSRSLADPHDPTAQVGEKRAVLRRLFKKSAPTLPQTTAVQNGTSVSKAPRAVALTLAREVHRLQSMDRYERRALSRRKFAIRALDEARQRAGAARLEQDPEAPFSS